MMLRVTWNAWDAKTNRYSMITGMALAYVAGTDLLAYAIVMKDDDKTLHTVQVDGCKAIGWRREIQIDDETSPKG